MFNIRQIYRAYERNNDEFLDLLETKYFYQDMDHEIYWIETGRQLTKKEIKFCFPEPEWLILARRYLPAKIGFDSTGFDSHGLNSHGLNSANLNQNLNHQPKSKPKQKDNIAEPDGFNLDDLDELDAYDSDADEFLIYEDSLNSENLNTDEITDEITTEADAKIFFKKKAANRDSIPVNDLKQWISDGNIDIGVLGNGANAFMKTLGYKVKDRCYIKIKSA